MMGEDINLTPHHIQTCSFSADLVDLEVGELQAPLLSIGPVLVLLDTQTLEDVLQ